VHSKPSHRPQTPKTTDISNIFPRTPSRHLQHPHPPSTTPNNPPPQPHIHTTMFGGSSPPFKPSSHAKLIHYTQHHPSPRSANLKPPRRRRLRTSSGQLPVLWCYISVSQRLRRESRGFEGHRANMVQRRIWSSMCRSCFRGMGYAQASDNTISEECA
jgi:hypothetical protein